MKNLSYVNLPDRLPLRGACGNSYFLCWHADIKLFTFHSTCAVCAFHD